MLRKIQGGFTLVEVMVAIGILGALGVIMLSTAGRAASDIASMQEKLVALQVAEYTLNTMLAINESPDLGTEEEVVTQAGRDWLLNVTVSKTPNEQVLRIDALVKPYDQTGSGEERTSVLLSAFKTDFTP